jgi:hypothetical protein
MSKICSLYSTEGTASASHNAEAMHVIDEAETLVPMRARRPEEKKGGMSNRDGGG